MRYDTKQKLLNRIGFVALAFVLFFIIRSVSVLTNSHARKYFVSWLATNTEDENDGDAHGFKTTIPSFDPSFYVDAAMYLPGAIVISPHRDLRDMGIISPNYPPYYTAGPAIGVPTKNGWCVWSLTDFSVAGQYADESYFAYGADIFGSRGGYRDGYSKLVNCYVSRLNGVHTVTPSTEGVPNNPPHFVFDDCPRRHQ